MYMYIGHACDAKPPVSIHLCLQKETGAKKKGQTRFQREAIETVEYYDAIRSQGAGV